MIWLWCTRVAWALLTGDDRNRAGRRDRRVGRRLRPAVAAVILWVGLGRGIVRVVRAPTVGSHAVARRRAVRIPVCRCFSVTSTSAASAVLALVGSGFAAVLALSAPTASATANALAYGDEQRFVAAHPDAAAARTGPDRGAARGRRRRDGPAAPRRRPLRRRRDRDRRRLPARRDSSSRALHPLSCRWFVLVPAGIAIADPLTLTEPVLVRREHIASVRRTASAALPPDALDLRLGTLAGGDRDRPLRHRRVRPPSRPRRRGDRHTARVVAVAVVRADAATRAGPQPPHPRLAADRAITPRRCRRRSRCRRRRTRRSGRRRPAAAATRTRNSSPSSVAATGAPCARDCTSIGRGGARVTAARRAGERDRAAARRAARP